MQSPKQPFAHPIEADILRTYNAPTLECMDNKRDIQGHGDRRDIAIFAKDTSVNPFGQSISSGRAYARAERIAAAIYLITNNVSENDSMRHRARDVAYSLVQSSVRLSTGFRGEDHPIVQEIAVHARELITILRLMLLSGNISVQNTNLITSALEDLLTFIKSASQSLLSERTVLSKSDLIPEETIHHTKNMGPRVVQRDHRSTAPRSNATSSYNSRQETILALLKGSGALGIKDIAAHIVGCSEKTVQRELVALTTTGKVSKTGEKRWSRYTIAA